MRFDEFDENDVEEMLSVMQGNDPEQFDAFIQEYGKGSVDSYKMSSLDVLKKMKRTVRIFKNGMEAKRRLLAPCVRWKIWRSAGTCLTEFIRNLLKFRKPGLWKGNMNLLRNWLRVTKQC